MISGFVMAERNPRTHLQDETGREKERERERQKEEERTGSDGRYTLSDTITCFTISKTINDYTIIYINMSSRYCL